MADLPSFDDMQQQGDDTPQDSGSLPSFDDLASQQSDVQSGLPSFDDMLGAQSSPPSALGTFARRALIEAPVGAAAAVGGAGAAALALPTAPFTLGAGPVVAGAAGGIGVGMAAQKAEDAIIRAMGLDKGSGFLSTAQRLADEEFNPKSSFSGELAGNVGPGFGPSLERNIAGRVLGAGLQGGLEAGQEAYQGEDLDPTRIGLSAAAGAIADKPRGWVPKFTGRPGARAEPGAEPGAGETQRLTGAPEASTADMAFADIIPPDKVDTSGLTPEDLKKYQMAKQAAMDAGPDDPLSAYWDEHAQDILNRGTGKGSAGIDVDATYGPAGDKSQFTYQDADRANDITTVARGVAAENPPAPLIAGAGNPVGAPMSQRTAARSSDPLRDYRKDRPQLPAPTQTQESVPLSTAQIHEDVASALQPTEPSTTFDQQTVRTPPEQQPAQPPLPAPPETPIQTGLPQRAPQAPPPGYRGGNGALPPEHQALIDRATQELTNRGMNTALDRLNTLEGTEKAAAAAKALNALQSVSGEATGRTDKIAAPQVRPKVGDVTARSKADADRKSGALKAWDDAVAAYGKQDKNGTIPTTTADKAALVDRLKQMLQHAADATGQANPLKAYRPNTKPASYSVLKAAQTVVAKPTPANIRAYFTAAQIGPEGAKDLQQTSRIDSDIARKPQIGEAASEAMAAKADTGSTGPDRIVHQPFDNSSGDESAVYAREQGQVRDWLNGLSDDAYAKVKAANPDMAHDLDLTQDPGELLRNYMDDLNEASGKRPGVLDVPAENVKARPQPVRSAADLDRFAPTPLEEGKVAAGAGKALDKNSPEFKAAAQAALAKLGQAKTLDLAHEEKVFRGKDTAPKDPDAKPTPIRDMVDMVNKMMQDQSGALNIQNINVPQWIKDAWSGKRTLEQEYADTLGTHFTKLHNAIAEFNHDVWLKVLGAKSDLPSPAGSGQIYRAKEKGEEPLLPADLRQFDQDHVAPMARQLDALYDEARTTAQRLGFDPDNKLYPRVNNGNGFNNYVPRLGVNQAWEGGTSSFDPIGARRNSLSPWQENLQERQYMALQDQNGNRKVIIPGDNQFTVKTNGAPSTVKFNAGGGFDPREVGSTITRNGNTWTVDHAGIDEIKAAAGKDPQGNWVEQYHDNPMLVYASKLINMNEAVQKLRTLDKIISDPLFYNNTTRSSTDPRVEDGSFVRTKLPQFKGLFMPRQWAWAMDDFVKEGLDFDSKPMQKAVDSLGNVASAGTKLMFFMQPLIHVGNELANWAPGRGLAWVSPKAYGDLVRTGATALKSVYTQDATQREIRAAGGNPMLMHTLAQDMMPHIGRQLGIDVAQNEAQWNPIAKKLNITTPLLARSIARQSQKIMWYGADVLYTQRYLEAKANGMTPEEAVQDAERVVDAYHMPPTVGSSGPAGRMLKQVLAERMVSLFSQYTYGIYKSIFNDQIGTMIMKNSTPYQRANAAAQLALTAGLGIWGSKALSDAYSSVTGQKEEVGARGRSKIFKSVYDVATGAKDPRNLTNELWTPSVPLSSVMELRANQDWAGRPIFKQGATAPEAVGQGLDYLTHQYASPLNALGNAAMGKTDLAGAGRQMAEGEFGIHTPSDAELKFQQKQPSILRRQNEKSGGPFEALTKKLGL